MKKYTYIDHKTDEVIFESIEEDSAKLTEVDVKFEEATGLKAVKAMWVGCKIKQLT